MKTLFFSLLLIGACQGAITQTEHVKFITKSDAYNAAVVASYRFRTLALAWCNKLSRICNSSGLSQMPKYVAPRFVVLDGKPFDEVEVGDDVVFWANNSAREIAKGAAHNKFIQHVCYKRTKDRIYTCGSTSIANPHPSGMHDGPVTRENYVGVVAWAGEWKKEK